MAVVVPTVLATTPEEYAAMIERARRLSHRVHVDICDGKFADVTTIGLAQVHVPEDTQLDLHLMVQDPAAQLETALSLHPNLIIFHAESEGDVAGCMQHVQDLGVQAGVAILPETKVVVAQALLEKANHALIFTGTLGHNGGDFHADQLPRSAEIRGLKPDLEISVDGGVTDANAADIVAHGIDVLYVGEFLQHAENPRSTYESLTHKAMAVS